MAPKVDTVLNGLRAACGEGLGVYQLFLALLLAVSREEERGDPVVDVEPGDLVETDVEGEAGLIEPRCAARKGSAARVGDSVT